MEDKDLTKLRAELGKYQEIIEYHRENSSSIGPNREQLLEMNNLLFNLSPFYLHLQFGEEIGEEIKGLVSTMNRDVIKLILEN